MSQDSHTGTLASYHEGVIEIRHAHRNIVQMDDSYLQVLIDNLTATVPVQDAIDADHFELTDLIRVHDRILPGVGICMGPCLSTARPNCLYYDKKAFSRGWIPKFPTQVTWESCFPQRRRLSGTHPRNTVLELQTGPTRSLYQWMALGGQTVVNVGNGHEGRATAVTTRRLGRDR